MTGVTSTLGPSCAAPVTEQRAVWAGHFQVDWRRIADQIIVRPKGELDAYSAPIFRRALCDRRGGPTNITVVVDLSQLTFMDASGIGVLIGARREIVARGGEIIVHSPPPSIARLFHIMGIDRIFTFTSTSSLS
jgi:anti-sigma B factor antagonist